MNKNILSEIQSPSQYLGNEINTAHKKWNDVKLHIVLAFPDLYEIGTSHFGMQILYNILNNCENILAERIFAPASDMEEKILSNELDLRSMESKTPILDFDILGFSLLYELNYTNMLNMLSLAKIPFIAAQRNNKYPLLIAGGPCTFNPEPIADFFDAIVIGDGEETIIQMSTLWNTWKKKGDLSKDDLLKEWIKIKGVYVPSFFEVSHSSEGIQKTTPKYSNYKKIEKAIINDLAKTPLTTKPIIPFGKPVHDRLRIEISRGCTRGCRFCQAGIIYRPVRERHPKKILELIIKSINNTGYEDISLLSLSTGDYCCILPLMEALIKYCSEKNISVSLPSLRAETLTPKIMNLVKKLRKTGFTIAPEAGSQKLRDTINKNICEEDITNTVKSAFSLGWKVIKLYFMIGLPTECQDDLQEIVNLVKKLNSIRKTFGTSGKINISVATFVPKAHTPFQWSKQINLKDSKEKIDWLKKNLRMPGVHFKWQDPHVSFIEGIFARGDRSLSHLLIKAYEENCKFDGWSDHFNFQSWQNALKKSIGNNVERFSNFKTLTSPLPWDHIRTGVDKNFLLQELEKSIIKKTTDDCSQNKCHNCGVCDFKLINPVLHTDFQIQKFEEEPYKQESRIYKKIGIKFNKINNGRYFSHLEMIKIFNRSLRRAKIPVKYSEGFHPSAKISFFDALPLGMESMNELMTLTVPHNFKSTLLKEKLNKQLPEGLNVIKCYGNIRNINLSVPDKYNYLIKSKNYTFDKNKLKDFIDQKNSILSRLHSKKTKKYDLKQIIRTIKIQDKKTLELTINTNKGSFLRPTPILQFIFKLDKYQLNQTKIVKL